jgi:hypothetical protein
MILDELDITYSIDIINDAINETPEKELRELRRVAFNTIIELLDMLADESIL